MKEDTEASSTYLRGAGDPLRALRWRTFTPGSVGGVLHITDYHTPTAARTFHLIEVNV